MMNPCTKFYISRSTITVVTAIKSEAKQKLESCHLVTLYPRKYCLSKFELFTRFSQNCEKRQLASSCPSVRMEQLGSHCTDFNEIWYLILFRKPVEEIRVSGKSDKNNMYFT